jgi:hypothetical protein
MAGRLRYLDLESEPLNQLLDQAAEVGRMLAGPDPEPEEIPAWPLTLGP